MTTLTPNSLDAAQASARWIRPWYVGAVVRGEIEGHTYPDCPKLLRAASEPQEGAGWLDPEIGTFCPLCRNRHNAGEEPPR